MSMWDQDAKMVNPVKGGRGMSTEHAAAALVIASLLFLVAVRRGFRGVGVPGVGSLNVG